MLAGACAVETAPTARRGGAGAVVVELHEKAEASKARRHRRRLAKGRPEKRTTPSPSPMASLQFGSFQAASAPSRLWGDRVESEDEEHDHLSISHMSDSYGSTSMLREVQDYQCQLSS